MEIEGMVGEGRIPLTAGETEAVDAIIAANEGAQISFTREGDQLLVYADDDTYDVTEDGTTTKRAA